MRARAVKPLWGSPGAVLEAMRAGSWDLDPELAALQSSIDLAAKSGAARAPTDWLPDVDTSTGRNAIDVGDRCAEILFECRAPRLVLLADLLSAEECDALITAASPGLERSGTLDDERGTSISERRTSRSVFLRLGETPVCRRLESRIEALLHWPAAQAEGLQVAHYGPGEEFLPHYDFFLPGSAAARQGPQRVGTLICYLNTPDCGGRTVFPDLGLSVSPHRGSALFFSYEVPSPFTRTLHAGTPVLAGEKWIATKWLTKLA